MKQILQNLKNGDTELAHIPTPAGRPGHLLIATRRSLISAGTECQFTGYTAPAGPVHSSTKNRI
jgi:hypothetical protein